MGEPGLVDEANLARARADLQFKRQLVADNLERLLSGLQKLRGSTSVPVSERERQIREGMTLAVRLSNLLREMADNQGDEPLPG
jgi:hypothetical protein